MAKKVVTPAMSSPRTLVPWAARLKRRSNQFESSAGGLSEPAADGVGVEVDKGWIPGQWRTGFEGSKHALKRPLRQQLPFCEQRSQTVDRALCK